MAAYKAQQSRNQGTDKEEGVSRAPDAPERGSPSSDARWPLDESTVMATGDVIAGSL
jgi:hypothetical protein